MDYHYNIIEPMANPGPYITYIIMLIYAHVHRFMWIYHQFMDKRYLGPAASGKSSRAEPPEARMGTLNSSRSVTSVFPPSMPRDTC